MADPAIQAFQASSEILAGAPIPFRFEVTWSSLSLPLRPTPLDAESVSNSLSRRAPVMEAEPREWEMVLPRMRAPGARGLAAPPGWEARVAFLGFTTALEPARLRRLAPAAGLALLLI